MARRAAENLVARGRVVGICVFVSLSGACLVSTMSGNVAAYLQCASKSTNARQTVDATKGFRCCT